MKQRRAKFKDELEWTLIQLQNSVYEYEGRAHFPILQAKAYEIFLKKHSNSKISEVVLQKIALLYRIAAECIEEDFYEHDLLIEDNTEFSEDDIDLFRNEAVRIYKDLSKSKNAVISESAKVSLFNIKSERCYYSGDMHDW